MIRQFSIIFAIVILNIGQIIPAELHAVESTFRVDERWTGDFEKIVEKRLIRVLVPYSKTFYFIDKADQRGLTYEMLKLFEKHLNKQRKKITQKIGLLVIPTKRDRLLPGLVEGVGDIASGNLTITPERQKTVDFSAPGYTGVDEIIITGPNSPPVKTLNDLSGKEIHVRASSSYYESLKRLNNRFKSECKKPVKLILADELLEDEDLLEMMNAGLISMIVMDSHKARFWSQIFKDVIYHTNIKVRTGGQIAWAIRKNSPVLKKVINAFMKSHKKGTLHGNILFKRYLQNTQWIKNSMGKQDQIRFNAAVEFLKKYSAQYDFDWLMVAALAYQESQIDQSKRSAAGAIGVMQILPSTAKDKNVNIPDIKNMDKNIHAGVRYLRFLRNRYFENEPMDNLNKMLFAFASYNAGPAKITRIRRYAEKAGLDPNVWFRNVELMAAKRIGREPVQYVGNIYKYYTAYRLMMDHYYKKEEMRKKHKK